MWTGFGAYDEEAAGPRAKTLWDWLGLLIVPAALAFGAYWLNRSQKETELKIAEEARKTEQKIATDRQMQATLEAYYDRMTELLLDHGLRESAPNSEIRTIAYARTVAVVKGLNGDRNSQLFAFLLESGLLYQDSPIIGLSGISLSESDLSGVDLIEFNMSGARLNRANLSGAYLSGTILDEAKLNEANLCGADLSRAIISGAYLHRANLQGADLEGADLREADLHEADLRLTDLRWTKMRGANLNGASLGLANLEGSDLSDAYLHGANLKEANLIGALNWRFEQFDQVIYLDGTVMPDGVKLRGKTHPNGPTYKEWKAQYLAKQGGA